MTDPLAALTFTTRTDDWSYQVACEEHPNFWFRLERQRDDQDVVTDFLLKPRGAFPDDEDLTPLGGQLLRRCYRELGLTPRPQLVFGDILASEGPADLSAALSAAQALYMACGSELLRSFGYTVTGSVVEKRTVDKGGLRHRTNKYDLVINSAGP